MKSRRMLAAAVALVATVIVACGLAVLFQGRHSMESPHQGVLPSKATQTEYRELMARLPEADQREALARFRSSCFPETWHIEPVVWLKAYFLEEVRQPDGVEDECRRRLRLAAREVYGDGWEKAFEDSVMSRIVSAVTEEHAAGMKYESLMAQARSFAASLGIAPDRIAELVPPRFKEAGFTGELILQAVVAGKLSETELKKRIAGPAIAGYDPKDFEYCALRKGAIERCRDEWQRAQSNPHLRPILGERMRSLGLTDDDFRISETSPLEGKDLAARLAKARTREDLLEVSGQIQKSIENPEVVTALKDTLQKTQDPAVAQELASLLAFGHSPATFDAALGIINGPNPVGADAALRLLHGDIQFSDDEQIMTFYPSVQRESVKIALVGALGRSLRTSRMSKSEESRVVTFLLGVVSAVEPVTVRIEAIRSAARVREMDKVAVLRAMVPLAESETDKSVLNEMVRVMAQLSAASPEAARTAISFAERRNMVQELVACLQPSGFISEETLAEYEGLANRSNSDSVRKQLRELLEKARSESPCGIARRDRVLEIVSDSLASFEAPLAGPQGITPEGRKEMRSALSRLRELAQTKLNEEEQKLTKASPDRQDILKSHIDGLRDCLKRIDAAERKLSQL